MSRKLLILLFLLCSGGLIFYAHGAEIQEQTGTQMSSSSSGDSGGGGGIVDTIMSEVEGFLGMIMDMIERVLDGVKSSVMGILDTIFMSDDTRMTTTRRRRSVDSSDDGSSSGGSSIMGMFADAFLAPFKMTFGLVREMSFDSIIDGVEEVMSPLNSILETPSVQTFTNSTKSVFDAAASEFWNFTKSTILPQLNDAVTTLRDSNTLPTSINNYLGDLQSIYSICHTFGMM